MILTPSKGVLLEFLNILLIKRRNMNPQNPHSLFLDCKEKKGKVAGLDFSH